MLNPTSGIESRTEEANPYQPSIMQMPKGTEFVGFDGNLSEINKTNNSHPSMLGPIISRPFTQSNQSKESPAANIYIANTG